MVIPILIIVSLFVIIHAYRGRSRLEKQLDILMTRLAKLEKQIEESNWAQSARDLLLETVAYPKPAERKPISLHAQDLSPERDEPVLNDLVQSAPPFTFSDSESHVSIKSDPQAKIATSPIAPPPPTHERMPPTAIPSPIVAAIRGFFTGGNVIMRLGLIVIFFGVAFLFKLGIDHGWFPVELRLAAVAMSSFVMMSLGWRMRLTRHTYATGLLGGGIGLLYLTLFAAFRLYHLLPPTLTFALLILVIIFSSLMAILLQAQAMAVIGICGGFLAPVLTASGDGNHIALFSYFLVLNLGILWMSWKRSWRTLNLLGFFFTFTLGTVWGSNAYTPNHFASTEPFLILFFIFYSTLIPLLFAAHHQTKLKGFIDATLVFGTPLVAFALQTRLVQPFMYGVAWSSIALAAYYLVLARVLIKRYADPTHREFRAMTEAILALGVVFLTLTIPMSLTSTWTSIAWAIESTALIWIGFRQSRLLARVSGILLFIAASIAFALYNSDRFSAPLVVNALYLNGFFLSLSAILSAFIYSRHRGQETRFERFVAPFLVASGLTYWFYIGIHEIVRAGEETRLNFSPSLTLNLIVLLATGTFTTCEILARRLSWSLLRMPAYGLTPTLAVAVITVSIFFKHENPLGYSSWGWIIWPLAFAAHFFFLKRIDHTPLSTPLRGVHVLGLWTGIFLLSLAARAIVSPHLISFDPSQEIYTVQEFEYLQNALQNPQIGINAIASTWHHLATWGSAVLALIGLTFFRHNIRWPFETHANTYLNLATPPLLVCLWIALLGSFNLSGDHGLFLYIPLLNPLDLLHAFFFLSAIAWLASRTFKAKFLMKILLGATIFIWITILLARFISHVLYIPYTFSAITDSMTFQTALTIYWSVLALTTVTLASKKNSRRTWMIGAALLGLTVMKLFLIDLSQTHTIARVISFIGAGLLMLVMGYLSPIPPKQTRVETTP